jgi:hypothetical protein
MATDHHPTDRLPPVALELAGLSKTGELAKLAAGGGLGNPGAAAALLKMQGISTNYEHQLKNLVEASAGATKFAGFGAALAAATAPRAGYKAALAAATAPSAGYEAALAAARASTAGSATLARLQGLGVEINAQSERIRDTIAGAARLRTQDPVLLALRPPETRFSPVAPLVDRTSELLVEMTGKLLDTQHELVSIAEGTETTNARRQRQMIAIVAAGIVLNTVLTLANFILK